MIEPLKDDIQKFQNYRVQDFARWLRVGLEGYVLDGLGVTVFEHVDYCIGVEHTLSADLQIIYEAFQAPQRSLFREAVARVLDRLPPEQRYAPVFEVLLDLAARVRAYEILGVIPSRGEGLLTIEQQNRETPSLYARTLKSIAELADRSAEAKACIERLIGTPGAFDFNHAGTALVALCNAAPLDFINHMNLLRDPIARNFRAHSPTEEAYYWLAYDIVKSVGLGEVQRTWGTLTIEDETSEDTPSDNWFRDAMLRMVVVENGFLRLRDNPDVRVSIETSEVRPDASEEEERSNINARKFFPELSDDGVDQQERNVHHSMVLLLVAVPRLRSAPLRDGPR